jgi:hypothetical protein
VGDLVGEKGDVSGAAAEAAAVAVAERRRDWLHKLFEAAVAVEYAVVGEVAGSWRGR